MVICVLPVSQLGLHRLSFRAQASGLRGETPRLFLPLCLHTPRLSSQLERMARFAALGPCQRGTDELGEPLPFLYTFHFPWS